MRRLYPLTVILTPATLTVALTTEVLETQCSSVRTLNFEIERLKNWRDPERINGYPGLSLSLWNNTVPLSSEIRTDFNETFFDYWTGPSWQTNMLSTLSSYSTNVVPRDNVALETCGGGWNCSYVISFVAPGYKCDQVARGRGDNTKALADMGAPFDTSWLLPDGDHSYVAHNTLGDYSSVQIDAQPGGAPLDTILPPYPKHLGAFRTEPVLWIGHVDHATPSETLPTQRKEANWNTSFIPTIFRCEHYYTNYTIRFNHTFSSQHTKILSRSYLSPVINTTFLPGVQANDGTRDNTTATPSENYILPLDLERYRLTGAYHSLGSQLRTMINGTIQYTPYVFGNTDALKTRLVNKSTYLAVDNLRERVVSFYENIVLSLLANPQFIVVAWAADPKRRTGMATATEPELAYPCTKTRTINAYAYDVRGLWLVYSFAIVAAVASVFFGALALAENNHHVRDTRVSSIVAATRAPCLEEMGWMTGSQWGAVPGEVKERRMGYGAVPDGEGEKVVYGFAPVEVMREGEGEEMRSPTRGSWGGGGGGGRLRGGLGGLVEGRFSRGRG